QWTPSFTDLFLDLIKKYRQKFVLVFSVDAHDSRMFRKLKGKDMGERVFANILYYIKAVKREEITEDLLNTVISYVECEQNRGHTQEFKDKWSEILKQNGISCRVHDSLENNPDFFSIVIRRDVDSQPDEEKSNGKPCPALFMAPAVTSDGRLHICCRDDRDRFIYGDMKKHSFSSLFYSESASSYRRKHLSGDFTYPGICMDCDGFYYPGGIDRILRSGEFSAFCSSDDNIAPYKSKPPYQFVSVSGDDSDKFSVAPDHYRNTIEYDNSLIPCSFFFERAVLKDGKLIFGCDRVDIPDGSLDIRAIVRGDQRGIPDICADCRKRVMPSFLLTYIPGVLDIYCKSLCRDGEHHTQRGSMVRDASLGIIRTEDSIDDPGILERLFFCNVKNGEYRKALQIFRRLKEKTDIYNNDRSTGLISDSIKVIRYAFTGQTHMIRDILSSCSDFHHMRVIADIIRKTGNTDFLFLSSLHAHKFYIYNYFKNPGFDRNVRKDYFRVLPAEVRKNLLSFLFARKELYQAMCLYHRNDRFVYAYFLKGPVVMIRAFFACPDSFMRFLIQSVLVVLTKYWH
ncbi:MAG: SPASM domain-containing protein, partial [Candidatus Muiribacteriaceae bacterium]